MYCIKNVFSFVINCCFCKNLATDRDKKSTRLRPLHQMKQEKMEGSKT